MTVRFQTFGVEAKSRCRTSGQYANFKNMLISFLFLFVCFGLWQPVSAQESEINSGSAVGSYLLNAGDVLQVEVWNEPTLSKETVLVRPDGFISIPVIGEIGVGGMRVTDAEGQIKEQLGKYLKDEPTVVVSVLQTGGSQIYVLGKVLRPGAFQLRGEIDVAQALALAGGTNQFAAENKIKVLRRDASGTQRVYKFKLGDIKNGDKLESNILLKSGDLVLVP